MNKMLEISKNQASIAQMEKEIENIKIATKYYTLMTEEINEEVQLKNNEYKKKQTQLNEAQEEYQSRLKKKKQSEAPPTDAEAWEQMMDYAKFFCKPTTTVVREMGEEIGGSVSRVLASRKRIDNAAIIVLYKTGGKEHRIRFSIFNDHYCFFQLLKQTCDFYNITDKTNYNFYDEDDAMIKMTMPILTYIRHLDDLSGAIPKIRLKPIPVEKLIEFDTNEYKDTRLLPKKSFDRTGKVLTSIGDIEDDLLKKVMKLLFYLIFLIVVFFYLLSQARIRNTYLAYESIKNNVINIPYRQKTDEKENYSGNNAKSFTKINCIDDVYNWLTQIFIHNFQHIYNETYITTVYDDYFLLIGQIRISIIPKEDTSNNEKNGSKATNTPIYYRGDYAVYNSYEADIDNISSPDITKKIRKIKEENKLSKPFDCFLIQMNLLNTNTRFYIPISMAVENNVVGSIKTSFDICSISFLDDLAMIKNSNFFKSNFIFVILFYLIIFIYLICSLRLFIIKLLKVGMRKFLWELLDFWNVVFLFQCGLFFSMIIMRLNIYIIFDLYFTKIDHNKFYDEANSLCHFQNNLLFVEIMSVALTVIYCLKQLDKYIVTRMFQTIVISIGSLCRFAACLLFTLFGYSFFISLSYGKHIFKFHSLMINYSEMFLLLFGDFSIIKILENSLWRLTQFFTFIFVITFYFSYHHWISVTLIVGYEKCLKLYGKTKVVQEDLQLKGNNFDIFKGKLYRSSKVFFRNIKSMVNNYLHKKYTNVDKDEKAMLIEMQNIDEQDNETYNIENEGSNNQKDNKNGVNEEKSRKSQNNDITNQREEGKNEDNEDDEEEVEIEYVEEVEVDDN